MRLSWTTTPWWIVVVVVAVSAVINPESGPTRVTTSKNGQSPRSRNSRKGCERLSNGSKPVYEVNLGRIPATDAELVDLKGMGSMLYLVLSGTRISNSGMAYLGGMKKLRKLDLSGTRISDAGLIYLEGMKDLRSLPQPHRDY